MGDNEYKDNENETNAETEIKKEFNTEDNTEDNDSLLTETILRKQRMLNTIFKVIFTILIIIVLINEAGKATDYKFTISAHNQKLINNDLMIAIINDNFEEVKQLIEKGANINAYDEDGFPLLVSSLWLNKDTKILQYLIDNGADAKAIENNERKTSLLSMLVVSSYDYEKLSKLKILVENGADINYIDTLGFTTLDYCFIENEDGKNNELISYLIKKGAKPKYYKDFFNYPNLNEVMN